MTTSAPAAPKAPPLTEQLEFDFQYEPWDIYRTPGYGPDVELPDYRPELPEPVFNRRCRVSDSFFPKDVYL